MFSRRDLLKLGLISGAYGVLGPAPRRRAFADGLPPSPPTTAFLVELPIAPIAQPVAPFPTRADPGDCVNVDGTTAFHVHGPRVVPTNTQFFLIHERAAPHSFHPQLPANVIWGYDGMMPGPTFMARSGTPFLVRFVNDLPENDPVGIGEPISAIHRHGGWQFPEDDGYPLDTFCSGQSRDYFYPNEADDLDPQNEHATLWYHDHAIDITAQNVYRGLAGFFLNFDEVDSMLGEVDPNPRALRLPGRMVSLPSGGMFREFDVPLVFQDRRFDPNGFLVYDSFDHNGFLGDKFLVNGVIQPFFKVARRKFRFERSDGAWVINGQFFDENRVNAKPRRSSAEIWNIEAGGGWVHPVHIHLTEFFILSRNGAAPPPLERGRKDTIVVGGDRGDAKILLPFPTAFNAVPRPATGRFAFHCHNIEHEDMRMMGQFEVQP